MSGPDVREAVYECLAHLRSVHDDAWHSLVDLDLAALPHLIDAFHDTKDVATQAAILSVVAEYRSPEALPFLLENLHSSAQSVWKVALDGLVTLGGREVRAALQQALARENATKGEWIREAIDQVDNEITSRGGL